MFDFINIMSLISHLGPLCHWWTSIKSKAHLTIWTGGGGDTDESIGYAYSTYNISKDPGGYVKFDMVYKKLLQVGTEHLIMQPHDQTAVFT